MTKLYHTEIGLPEDLLKSLLGKRYKLSYSRHAMNEVLTDSYGAPKRMPMELTVSRAAIFEVEIIDGWITKICVRLSECIGYIPKYVGLDLILVLVPDRHNTNSTFFVKTLWFNESTDAHATLDRSKYATT